MSDIEDLRQSEDVQQELREVQELLARHRVVEGLVHRQEMPRHELVENIVHKQHIAELRAKLDELHPADIAYVLEALPLDERLFVWDLVKADRDGEILLEVSDAVRETLIEAMDSHELVAATEQLDTDEIADLAPDLPSEVMQDVFRALSVEEREQLRAAMSYDEDSVGALMDFEAVTVREDVTLEAVLRYLRRFDELPDHTDQLFVVDREERLQGVLPLNLLLVTDPDEMVSNIMVAEPLTLEPDEKAQTAAQAFERYDLVSAPVVDKDHKLVGRVTVNAVVDYIRESTETEQLSRAGLREGEDIFASVWDSVKNRWSWLAINLITAFVASRVIGAFEGSIEKLGGAGRPDADRRRHRRQFGQPDHHHDRARHGARPGATGERPRAAAQGDRRGDGERPDLGQPARLRRLVALPQRAARAGDDGGDDAEPDGGGGGRRRRAAAAPAPGLRSGHRFQRDDPPP
jgi:Mg/Co/Ni transporter MgtE (contains CBS domain)